ncbi:HAD family hydrolase [Clostridium felsineum]|uniref:Phosphatase YwpJ n=1 Tax=Clostridium felsineum TaxID=36839 RepID=A0A1S8LAJ8_9CLOT|nr:HAD family hydrolase [Clostridium felsineum]MCR3760017.1 Cof-type HAD-IIB family hydrolase [Clostridium felsineum]URZ04508.1 Phosphatase YwpJ [Clostridium felsineum]URZ09055.1 Phosphatase YwpJ [Clostridium felsineum]URZ13742.1 Phosphatase YwpJ [Clostridium felsineum]
MKRKVIFLDVDGTLVNDNGIVPKSASLAIKNARKNGHYVFLCTGRSKAELFDHIMDIGFDGIIAAAGGYIEFENKVLMHKKVMPEDVKHLVKYFDDNNIDFYLESNGGLFASKNCKKHLNSIIFNSLNLDDRTKKELEEGMLPFINTLIEGENLIRDDINKISFLNSSISIEVIKEEFKDKFNVIHCTVPAFGENSGELSIPGIHKALAIENLLNHINIDKEDTLAYGDGSNDIEMLKFVQVGVAMGNANENLKNVADDITDTHDNNGIYNSFKKYNLIN